MRYQVGRAGHACLYSHRNSCEQLLSESNQRRFLRLIMTDLDVILAHFIRAQLILAGISLVVYSVVLTALRFPYALALGFAAGAMEFIPVVGPLVAALVIVFVGFLTTYPHLWALILFFAVWRVVQDYFVSPRVMGGTLKVHPLAAIAAVLMGAELGGVLGVYLSIPVAATIRIVWVRWQKYSAVIATAAAQGDIPESNAASMTLGLWIGVDTMLAPFSHPAFHGTTKRLCHLPCNLPKLHQENR